MKRSKQGYVLVLVMVVTLVLCSIASIIAATVSNNLSKGVIDFSKKQMDYEVKGLAEQYLMRLDSLDGFSETITYEPDESGDPDEPDEPSDPDEPGDPDDLVHETELNDYFDQLVHDIVNQVRDDFISQDSGFLDKKTDAEKVTIIGAKSVVFQSSYGERMYQVDLYDAEPDSISPEKLIIKIIVNRLYMIDETLNEEPLLTSSFAVQASLSDGPEENQCTMNLGVDLISYRAQ